MRRLDLVVAIVQPIVVWGPAVLLAGALGLVGGWAVRERRRASALSERVRVQRELLAAQRAELDRAVPAGERQLIAGEVHEVVAHVVSVMTLRVGGARLVMRRDPEQAEAAMREAEDAGRLAVAELRRLAALPRPSERTDGDSAGSGEPPPGPSERPWTDLARAREPLPGLADLPRLVAEAEAGGLAVRLGVAGTPPPLSPMFEVSVCRIVQEALANAVRHGAARTAEVSLRWCSGALDLLVRDHGTARAETVTPGRGLAGMAERAALFGGTLSAAAHPAGGFEVRVRLPAPGSGPGGGEVSRPR
ncbi:sensor histidine kinase [Spongiactinospora sp. 9N601]|uniref:sensor histidine kinase n=1 Tax=Spongiactinospora sp. 9N601 TaxID=3375149 RepID=UPI00379D1C08